MIPRSSYHTCSSLSEVRLCYFIELPSSMMDYADLCFFLKDIIQKVGVGYRIILTQKESPYKSNQRRDFIRNCFLAWRASLFHRLSVGLGMLPSCILAIKGLESELWA
nr:hypothetical protein Q903MT_gene146 [Picea sitchensis]